MNGEHIKRVNQRELDMKRFISMGLLTLVALGAAQASSAKDVKIGLSWDAENPRSTRRGRTT